MCGWFQFKSLHKQKKNVCHVGEYCNWSSSFLVLSVGTNEDGADGQAQEHLFEPSLS